ncbi:amino acid aminotransferase [Psychrobium sp. 1_MG-2023]|uniref:amino acid aminotransferase n=1 Tax=Psychrobium sp. 1_MG-2023 TaxID=3062624 RepID=UPI000C31DD6E|nr:amino acid aminotransferase [Psychrobium sp. 1_MG-2023]MDP2562185.1 amino acid aminotransferase [Psychrobium sp. 1_MG-2023]PKF58111.1 aromatic amino acid aminotransferase [Alteromonadales bacterium alter-6D02]
MFEVVKTAPADPILGLTEAFKNDPRPHKINLGVGIYKTDQGDTPVLECVKKAEALLLSNETTKSYLSIEGNAAYAKCVQSLLFGADSDIVTSQRAATAQAPGGTGSLRIAADFMVSQLGIKRIWVSNPTWANHGNIFKAAGLEIVEYTYYNPETKSLDFSGMLESLKQAAAGDAVLFHGCCHNPTGIDPTAEQWQQIAQLANEKKLLGLFDFAYQGFGVGIEEDALGLRLFAQTNTEFLVANSFSKNFGLYNERVGAVTLVASSNNVATSAFSQIKGIIRSNYSNPPSHGAAVVATILNDHALTELWHEEVAQMRQRIHQMRELFVTRLKDLNVEGDFSFITSQCGMFSFSGLTKAQVEELRAEHAVYIVGSGRISVAGMTTNNMDALCEGIKQVLQK